MSLHKDPDLKKAVLSLPQKEKDKLLVRLINKDKMLIKQLHFQLLEDEQDLENRIYKLKKTLYELFEDTMSIYKIKNQSSFQHYKNLNSLMRDASGIINEHEKVTKDKFSEVECRIFILKEAFKRYPTLFNESLSTTAFKLHKYTSLRIKATITKYKKLHEDLQFDLKEELENILSFASTHRLA